MRLRGNRLVSVLVATVALATATTACETGDGPSEPRAVEPPASEAEANSADRLIFWGNCDEVKAFSDAVLDDWKARGVDGFLCGTRQLAGMGGSQEFTGALGAGLDGAQYQELRSYVQSDIGRRAAARGMKIYMGFWLANLFNTSTPLKEWFDDAGWAEVVVPKVREIAAAAKALGFAGVALDQELYPQEGNVTTATWSWNYPGNTHTEHEVRAKAKQRGAELMMAMLAGFPQVEIMAYGTYLPETWDAFVQQEVNGIKDAYRSDVMLDFWDGLSSVEGYQALRLVNATFYKTPHVRGSSWDTALEYQYNRLHSLLSRRLSNWDYASTRLFESPFAWIDEGSSDFEKAQSPDRVSEQLLAFRRWGMGREFANFAYAPLSGFDYGPYLEAMRQASTPALVDPEPPTVSVTDPAPGPDLRASGAALTVSGTAHDNLAVRAVRWENDQGGSGTAPMEWKVKSGDERSGWDWEMRWSVRDLPLKPGANRITIVAEDIKGLVTRTEVTVSA